MVTTKLNLSMTEPSVRQIYAKQGDTGRVLDITLDQTPEDGTLRILRPDGIEVTSEAVTGGEVSESGETVTFESMTEADVTELTAGIEPVQDLSHGDPSPTNICPITGHDEVRVFFGAEQGTADETYTTSLGQTVYGGTLDMVSGVLTVDKVIQDTFTVAGYLQFGNNKRFTISYPSGMTPNYKGASTYGISNIMKCLYMGAISNVERATEPCFMPHTTGILVTMPESTGVTASAEMATWLSNNGAQFVYELATPQTYTLTAQQIKTLVGTNNVWASSGQIVNIKFTYGGLLSELPSDATSVVGKCYCDVEQNGVSSMPFTLNIKKNERQ